MSSFSTRLGYSRAVAEISIRHEASETLRAAVVYQRGIVPSELRLVLRGNLARRSGNTS